MVPIVVFSVIYNLSKFYEVQTVPGFYEFPNSTVSTVLLNELCTVPVYLIEEKATGVSNSGNFLNTRAPVGSIGNYKLSV